MTSLKLAVSDKFKGCFSSMYWHYSDLASLMPSAYLFCHSECGLCNVEVYWLSRRVYEFCPGFGAALAHRLRVYYAFSGCSWWSNGVRRCVSIPYGSPEKSGWIPYGEWAQEKCHLTLPTWLWSKHRHLHLVDLLHAGLRVWSPVARFLNGFLKELSKWISIFPPLWLIFSAFGPHDLAHATVWRSV